MYLNNFCEEGKKDKSQKVKRCQMVDSTFTVKFDLIKNTQGTAICGHSAWTKREGFDLRDQTKEDKDKRLTSAPPVWHIH